MKPALIIGSTCVDVIINISHLPKTGEDIHPDSQSMALGGCAFNVAYAMELLKAPYTLISPVGGGTYGDYAAKQLTSLGIPLQIRVPDQENGCCYCLVEASGERTFLSLHGVEYTSQQSWMEPYPSENYHFAYVCGLEIEEKTGIHLIEYLEGQKNLEVFYAPGPRGARISPEKRARMLALHPFLHLNEQEAMELSGQTQYEKAARHLQAATKNAVVVTLGNRGAFCLKKDGTGRLFPPAPVKAIVDTIGAGDTHAGAILACLTKGKPLEEAVAYANRMAAAVVKVRGASLPPGLIPHF